MKPDHQHLGVEKKIGFTNTLGKEMLPKSDILIEMLGNLDEASSMIGFARSYSVSGDYKKILLAIQKDLASIMAHIATLGKESSRIIFLPKERLLWLQKQKAEFEQIIQVPKGFIYPGDTSFSAILDVCRTIVRKAERRLTEVYLQKLTDDSLSIQYLNTLSQLLYFMEVKTISDENIHPD